jgi:hypothetical protein
MRLALPSRAMTCQLHSALRLHTADVPFSRSSFSTVLGCYVCRWYYMPLINVWVLVSGGPVNDPFRSSQYPSSYVLTSTAALISRVQHASAIDVNSGRIYFMAGSTDNTNLMSDMSVEHRHCMRWSSRLLDFRCLVLMPCDVSVPSLSAGVSVGCTTSTPTLQPTSEETPLALPAPSTPQSKASLEGRPEDPWAALYRFRTCGWIPQATCGLDSARRQ